MRPFYYSVCILIFFLFVFGAHAQVLSLEHEANQIDGFTRLSFEKGILKCKAGKKAEGFLVIKSDVPLRLETTHNVEAVLKPGWDGTLGYKCYGLSLKMKKAGRAEVRFHRDEAPGKPKPSSSDELEKYRHTLERRPSRFQGDAADLAGWQNRYRDSLIQTLMGGAIPERVPGKVNIEYEKAFENFRLISFTYQSREDRRNEALLSIPNDVQKAPLLVALHGHETTWGKADSAAFREGHIDDFCAFFANRGWAVLQPATMDHHLQYPDWTLQGEWTWDAITAIDVCNTYPSIAMDRIAVCGLSTGAHLAMNLLALDDRVQCGVVACILSTWNHYEKRMRIPPHCDCGISHQLSSVMEQCDWAALAAPKPVQFQHGLQDASFCPGADASLLDLEWNTGILPPGEYGAMFAEIEKAYELYEKDGNVSTLFHHGPHSVNNEKAFDWITSALGQARSDLITTGHIQFMDLDRDGDPDVLQTRSVGGIPVQWIDDDDDMHPDDLQGDRDSDCLMVDRNNDGTYGAFGDLMVDWVDEDKDGKADIQLIADNRDLENGAGDPGHFMISIDTDQDGVFNYVDWTTFKLEAWEHAGKCAFFSDYSGQSMFLKIHASTFDIEDLRFNWENPFLFYDWDDDQFTEMTIRLVDSPLKNASGRKLSLSKEITSAYLSFDMDNDSRQHNDFDYDMSLRFKGSGFGYDTYSHPFHSLSGLREADTFFLDPRWRQLSELIYVGHEEAYSEVFEEGIWDECWFVFDEDDDCHRWERVEFYEPENLFSAGARKGGLDNNPQADVSGDRGEWDRDNSGKGKMYISGFDGKLHLFGAETGAWRIDRHATYYQGWQGWRGGGDHTPNDPSLATPENFPTIRYSDSDLNGFLDVIEYDMDGDTLFEQQDSILKLGVSDTQLVYNTAGFSYGDYRELYRKMSENMWERALDALRLAEVFGLETDGYADMLHPATEREKYHYGFWLNYLIYQEMMKLGERLESKDLWQEIKVAYYSGKWDILQNNQ